MIRSMKSMAAIANRRDIRNQAGMEDQISRYVKIMTGLHPFWELIPFDTIQQASRFLFPGPEHRDAASPIRSVFEIKEFDP